MRRVTLGQVFGAATLAIGLVLVIAFGLFVQSSRASIVKASQRQQELVAQRIAGRVVRELGRAQRVLEDIERAVRAGAIDVEDQRVVEADFFALLLDDAHLEEITFTGAQLDGYDAKGDAQLSATGRWQLSVYRAPNDALVTKSVRRANDGATYDVLVRDRGKVATLNATSLVAGGTAPDPTLHLTFSVAASKSLHGKAIWSDLHWSELDHAAPQQERRVVVSVQKSIEDAAGHFLGVLRVGLVTSELDAIARVQASAGDPEDVQRVGLLATAPNRGTPRLVARIDPSDRIVAEDGEIRVVTDKPPPEVRALLASPIVRGLDRAHPNASGSLVVDGEPWLATLREIELGETVGEGGTAGWMVAILSPEARYTADLVAFERMFLSVFGAALFIVLAIGALTLTAVRRGLARIVGATTRMRAFDFTPVDDASNLREIDDVMQGLERAKTVVRAMGKYVPIDLVRRLYHSNQEPQLGGELIDVALMFTDIEGFTTLSEKMPPDRLALRLGDYLAAMTTAIEETNGTIDKYIGDAVMAIWGAPTPVDVHARRACRAALGCMEATRVLYASAAWKGLPPLVTRFGLHEARVMVGHFGAPTRLSYTALGDGVNLAARLEPLCKQYGVVVLASEAIAEDAKDEFVFRRIDRVAVKGKTTCIDVYELLGAKGDDIPYLDRARRYEKAFDAYLARDFASARELLEGQIDDDPPSAVLAKRCGMLAKAPPPEDWDGVHVASSK